MLKNYHTTMMKTKQIRLIRKANYYAGWPSDTVLTVSEEMAKRLIEDGFAEEVKKKKVTRKKKTDAV